MIKPSKPIEELTDEELEKLMYSVGMIADDIEHAFQTMTEEDEAFTDTWHELQEYSEYHTQLNQEWMRRHPPKPEDFPF